jgi:hypothetical protein
VYATPCANPDTVIGEDAPVPVKLDGLDNTEYDVIAFPPVAFAVNGTNAENTPIAGAVTVPTVGACGTVVAVTEADADEDSDVPPEFVAVIVKV